MGDLLILVISTLGVSVDIQKCVVCRICWNSSFLEGRRSSVVRLAHFDENLAHTSHLYMSQPIRCGFEIGSLVRNGYEPTFRQLIPGIPRNRRFGVSVLAIFIFSAL
jgi:hypothetical protein